MKKQKILRIDKSLEEQAVKEAKKQLRSFNNWVVMLITKALRK